MAVYVEQENGYLVTGNMTIPNDKANRHYRQVLEDVKGSLSTITPYDVEAGLILKQEAEQLVWAANELRLADIELNKILDNDPKAVGTEAELRNYRKELRAHNRHPDYPTNERPTVVGRNL